MKRLLVDHKDITRTTLEDIEPSPLGPGQARLRLDNFALTSNNVTYAASGFAIGYWRFFPTGIDGLGLVPVWGTAEVVESDSAAVAVGARLYGFFPMTEELMIRPDDDGHGGIVDAAAHRTELPAVYNRYARVRGADNDHIRALLQPLLATSYLIYDWLMDNDCFGASQIVIGSASSKTGLGLCKYLAERVHRSYKIVALTSAGNRRFVEELDACDKVLSYDEIAQLAPEPSVYVDMSGNGSVKQQVHAVLGRQLKHSAAVGISHWDQFQPQIELEGVKPEFFFAPAQIAKRREEWGPGVIEEEITKAWKRLASDAGTWLRLRTHSGLPAAEAVYLDLAHGRADPRDGHIIVL